MFLKGANGIFTLCQGFQNFYNKISQVTFSLKAGTLIGFCSLCCCWILVKVDVTQLVRCLGV